MPHFCTAVGCHGNRRGVACASSAYCDNGTCKSRVEEFALQDVGARPRNIAAGGDRNLWFTDGAYDKSRRIRPSGSITEFVVPTTGGVPAGIAAGPDGNVWFTEETGEISGALHRLAQ